MSNLERELENVRNLLERKHAELVAALRSNDLSLATFPRVGTEARIELQTRQSQLQWVLEMLSAVTVEGR